jgi:hypothetical protein
VFIHFRHEFVCFKYGNSCFLSNDRSHKTVANKTYCAYCCLSQVKTRARVSATMSMPPLRKLAFDLEATQRERAFNAIVK